MTSWASYEWLSNNYTLSNGLPEFFVMGGYSYSNKHLAIKEYKDTVELANYSIDHNFCKWAKGIKNNDYAVLENIHASTYWQRLLQAENNNALNEQVAQIRGYHLRPFNFSYNLPPPISPLNHNYYNHQAPNLQQQQTKRPHTPSNEGSSTRSKRRTEFHENDYYMLDGMEQSLGTMIGIIARNSMIHSRHSRYFISCGMNGIIDVSDVSDGSQMSNFDDSVQDNILSLINLPIDLNNDLNIKALKHFTKKNSSASNKIYLENFLKRVDKYETDDIHQRNIKKIYQHAIELHYLQSHLFKKHVIDQLSEEDFVIKFWSPVLETIFRDSGLDLHWGDTVPNHVKSAGRIKLDLRIIYWPTQEEEIDHDTGSGEFGISVSSSKFYKDKLKAVIASKSLLNAIVKQHPHLSLEDLIKLKIPFVIVLGFEAQLCVLELIANGLYALRKIESIMFPSSIQEVRNYGISEMITKLSLLLELCQKINDVLNSECSTVQKGRRKKRSMDDLMKRADVEESPTTDYSSWTRDTWIPPKFKDNEEDDLNNESFD